MEESRALGATNYFDKLPDELITKIFQLILDELEDEENFWDLRLHSKTLDSIQQPSLAVLYDYKGDGYRPPHKIIRNFREISAGETLLNLCLTCKRFNRIINGEYFTTPDSMQWPSLRISTKTKMSGEQAPCSNVEDSKLCACPFIKTATKSKFTNYKKLEVFNPCDLGCFVRAITDERSNLSMVVELNFRGCDMSVVDLNNILVALPNVKRLSLYVRDVHHKGGGKEPAAQKQTGRILSSLNLGLKNYHSKDPLYEYILNNLPAQEIRMQFEPDNLEWVREYLLRHKNTIKNSHSTLQDLETIRVRIDELKLTDEYSGWWNDRLVYKAGGHDGYFFISSRGRSRPTINSEHVKYKRLALHSSTSFEYSRVLKAIQDDAACLSEVVELSLHCYHLNLPELRKILAIMPNIERLSICKRAELRINYFFSSGQQPKRRRHDNLDDLFDCFLGFEPDVHDHILENPPEDKRRVKFKLDFKCKCCHVSTMMQHLW